jgi:predicted TPR repeat methyltransferase
MNEIGFGRNDLCPCGSGKKYKNCHMPGAEATVARTRSRADAMRARIDAALRSALVHHRAGRLADAANIYWQVLQEFPQEYDAMHLLGMAAHDGGDDPAAEELIAKAIAIAPDIAEMHSNLGVVQLALGKVEAALASGRRAVELNPELSNSHNNLGAAYQALGRLDDAVSCYMLAIAKAQDYPVALNNLGGVLQLQGKYEEALPYYDKAVLLDPNYVDAIYGRGRIYHVLGRTDDAVAGFRRILELDPGNGIASHMLAALTGATAEQAPAAYVKSVFDTYADTFDVHLEQVLDYRTPQQIVALAAGSAAPQKNWDVLDLGCGTGLAGAAIAPFARQLVGVDVSRKMLQKAASRGVYSRLIEAELLSALAGGIAASYDVVLAADVFVYFGRLENVFMHVKRLLRAGGRFAFSIEALDAEDADYRLNPSARFAHSPRYVERLAADAGLTLAVTQPAQLRLEHGEPVSGILVLCENTA